MTSSTEDPVPELALENDDVTNSKTDSFEEELSDAALNEEEDNNFDVDPVDITIEEGVDPDQDINLNNDLDASPQDGDNAGELPECESGPEAGKMVRNKRKPTRFEDCMLDLSEVGEISQPEDFDMKKMKSVKFSLDPSLTTDELSLPQSPESHYDEDRGAAFDIDGNFRFKLGKEHVIRSRLGGLTSYRCDICEMTFPRSFSLRRHYERIHINPRFVRNKGKKDQEMVRKLIDNDRKNNLLRIQPPHQGSEVGKESSTTDPTSTDKAENTEDASFFVYACKLCSRYQIFFKTKELLRRHYQSRHMAMTRKKMETYKCDTCDRSYATRHELHRHKRCHSGERPYACRYCGKRFPTSTNARRHERTHTGDRPHSCKVCGKGFIQKTDMSKHLRTVHRVKVTLKKDGNENREESDDMSPVHDATNNNNRFEENIDFAAYLKLDQFEKGSLMGGCDVEPSFANSQAGSSAFYGNNGSPATSANANDDEGGAQEGSVLRNVPHKCPECFKTFSSKINMRRHYRLKHERDQALRSSFPVSMVVKKFKIENTETDVAKEVSSIRKDWKDSRASGSLLPLTSGVSSSPPASKPHLAPPKSSLSLDTKASSNSPLSMSSGVDLGSSRKLENKPPGSKRGAKLGMILEKLSMKKAKESKLTSPMLDEVGSSMKKENLISSNTLLQSMQPVRKKPQTDPPKTVPPNVLPMPQMLKEKEFKDSGSKVDFYASRMRQALSDKIREDNFRLEKEKLQKSIASFGKDRRFNNDANFQNIFRSQSGSLHQRPPRDSSAAYRDASLPFNYDRSLMEDRHKLFFKDVIKDRFPPRYSPSFRRRDHKKSFLEDCWDQKINNIPVRLPSSVDKISHSVPAWLAQNKNSNSSSSAQIFAPKPGCYKESPMNLKRSSKDSNDLFSGNIPLDLSHPTKKSTSSNYSVTKDGVLDLSKKPTNSIESNDQEKKQIDARPFPELSYPDHRGLNLVGDVPPLFPNVFNQGALDPRTASKSNFDNREMKMQSSSAPLKFHAVKFDKDRQTQGLGTAGRPSKTGLNQFKRFPSHPGIGSSPFLDETLPRSFVNPPDTKQNFSPRDRMFHHKPRQHPHLYAPYNRNLKDRYDRHQPKHFPPNRSMINPEEKIPASLTDSSRIYPFGSTTRHPQSVKPSSLSFPKQSAPDPRIFPRVFPTNMPSCTGGARGPTNKLPSDFDDDVMRRCIKKAQRALNQHTSAGSSSTVTSQSRTLAASELVRKNLRPPIIKEERVSTDAPAFSDVVCKVQPRESSPGPFLVSQKPSNVLDASSRDKLTMTPGFDTNGDDSSKDEEFASLIIPHASESSFEKKCPRKSLQEKSLQSVEKHDGLKSNLKEVSGFTKQIELQAETDKIVAELGSTATSSSDHVQISEQVNDEGSKLDENSLESSNRPQFAANIASTAIREAEGQLTAVASGDDVSMESVFQPIKSPRMECSDSSSKKFIQKIKLRAIKSQDKSGGKKWTLVGDNPSSDKDEDNLSDEKLLETALPLATLFHENNGKRDENLIGSDNEISKNAKSPSPKSKGKFKKGFSTKPKTRSPMRPYKIPSPKILNKNSSPQIDKSNTCKEIVLSCSTDGLEPVCQSKLSSITSEHQQCTSASKSVEVKEKPAIQVSPQTPYKETCLAAFSDDKNTETSTENVKDDCATVSVEIGGNKNARSNVSMNKDSTDVCVLSSAMDVNSNAIIASESNTPENKKMEQLSEANEQDSIFTKALSAHSNETTNEKLDQFDNSDQKRVSIFAPVAAEPIEVKDELDSSLNDAQLHVAPSADKMTLIVDTKENSELLFAKLPVIALATAQDQSINTCSESFLKDGLSSSPAMVPSDVNDQLDEKNASFHVPESHHANSASEPNKLKLCVVEDTNASSGTEALLQVSLDEPTETPEDTDLESTAASSALTSQLVRLDSAQYHSTADAEEAPINKPKSPHFDELDENVSNEILNSSPEQPMQIDSLDFAKVDSNSFEEKEDISTDPLDTMEVTEHGQIALTEEPNAIQTTENESNEPEKDVLLQSQRLILEKADTAPKALSLGFNQDKPQLNLDVTKIDEKLKQLDKEVLQGTNFSHSNDQHNLESTPLPAPVLQTFANETSLIDPASDSKSSQLLSASPSDLQLLTETDISNSATKTAAASLITDAGSCNNPLIEDGEHFVIEGKENEIANSEKVSEFCISKPNVKDMKSRNRSGIKNRNPRKFSRKKRGFSRRGFHLKAAKNLAKSTDTQESMAEHQEVEETNLNAFAMTTSNAAEDSVKDGTNLVSNSDLLQPKSEITKPKGRCGRPKKKKFFRRKSSLQAKLQKSLQKESTGSISENESSAKLNSKALESLPILGLGRRSRSADMFVKTTSSNSIENSLSKLPTSSNISKESKQAAEIGKPSGFKRLQLLKRAGRGNRKRAPFGFPASKDETENKKMKIEPEEEVEQQSFQKRMTTRSLTTDSPTAGRPTLKRRKKSGRGRRKVSGAVPNVEAELAKDSVSPNEQSVTSSPMHQSGSPKIKGNLPSGRGRPKQNRFSPANYPVRRSIRNFTKPEKK